MKVANWSEIERFLSLLGSSAGEINAIRLIFNNALVQSLLMTKFGLLTKEGLSSASYTDKDIVLKNAGLISDLGSLEVFDLMDFMDSYKLGADQAKTITANQRNMLDEHYNESIENALMESLTNPKQLAFSMAHIVQTGFPHRKTTNTEHTRKNGNLTVTMTAPSRFGLPYGVISRLIYVHICTQIITTGSTTIKLGSSQRSFMEDSFNWTYSTGERGTSVSWRAHLLSVLSTSLTIIEDLVDESRTGIHLKNIPIVDEALLWWDDEYNDRGEAFIKVSDRFAELLLGHAVPLDFESILTLALQKSPMAFDMYCWLTYRYWRMGENKESLVPISWRELSEQIGHNYSSVERFRKAAIKELAKVRAVYPEAHFNTDNTNALILTTSSAHVDAARIPIQEELL